MKKLKKKQKKINIDVREYFYIFGFIPLIWSLSLPVTIAFSIKTSFAYLFLDFILVMQIMFILYLIYDVKSSGYSLMHIYQEHKKSNPRNIVLFQIILYILIDAAIIIWLFLNK